MPSQVINQTGVITFQTVFTAAFQKVLTVPFAHMLLSRIHINNTSAKLATIRACYVHPSAKPNINNSVLWDLVIQPNEYIQFGDGEILDRDWSIQIMSPMASAQVTTADNVGVDAPEPQVGDPPVITFFLSAYALEPV